MIPFYTIPYILYHIVTRRFILYTATTIKQASRSPLTRGSADNCWGWVPYGWDQIGNAIWIPKNDMVYKSLLVMSGICQVYMDLYGVYVYIYIYIWYIYIYKYMSYVYIKISIHQNVKRGRTAVRWHPLAAAAHGSAIGPGLSTDLHGSFWSPVSLVGMPHRSDIDRLSRCNIQPSWPNIGKPHNNYGSWGIYLIYL